MTDETEFAVLIIRQVAIDNEADAARHVEKLAAEMGIDGGWERVEMTNISAEGTGEVIRSPALSQAALKAAVDASPNSERIARYFVVPTA